MASAQPRQALQPQAGRLGLGMAVLPWLDRLRRRRDVEEPPDMAEHDRVLDRDARIGAASMAMKNAAACPRLAQRSPAAAVLPAAAEVEMLRPAVGEEGARRMRDQQVPAVVQDVADVARRCAGRAARGQQVAGHRVVAARPEGVADHAGELAGNEDAHRQVTRRPACASASGPRAPAPRPAPSRSAFTAAKLRPSPSRMASRPVSACQRSTATST